MDLRLTDKVAIVTGSSRGIGKAIAAGLAGCLALVFAGAGSSLWVTPAAAEEIIFLQDGRTIQAEKTEIIGDRVRIERPAEIIELPRSAVLSIHRVSPPATLPAAPPPADVYRDLSQQMTDKVRREIQERPGASRPRSP